jgi:hypothetical protein
MKSIFDQYKSVNEGVLSKSQFLRNVKMSLPKFISNITTFNDAVKILKNKGIITEAKLNEMTLENWTEEVGDEINNYLADGSLTQEEANKAHDYLEDNYYEMGMYNDSIHDPLEAIDYILKKLNIDKVLNIFEISRLQEAKLSSMEYGMESDYCNPQEYDLGMRYELGKGTDEEKADKIVKKNLADNVAYYSQFHLAGYNEEAMKKDRKKRTDLPVEVKKDNFVDTANGVKKVKMDKLTEDELKILIGNILAEVADQKKTNLNESIEDNITQIVDDFNKKYTFYGSKHKSDMQKIFRMSAIKQILKNPNLTDEDKQKLEAELAANKPEPVKSTTSAGPGSVELYRLGQIGNRAGD